MDIETLTWLRSHAEISPKGLNFRIGRRFVPIDSSRRHSLGNAMDGSTLHPAVEATIETAKTYSDFYAEHEKLRADGTLTKEGKTPKLREIATKAANSLLEAGKKNAAFKQSLSTLVAQHLKMPKAYEANDLVKILSDRETRDALSALPLGEAMHLVMGEQSDPHAIEAVLRAPTSFGRIGQLREHAQIGWRELRDKADPETARQISVAEEIAEWATPWPRVFAGFMRQDADYLIEQGAFRTLVPQEAQELFI